jgi:hypothetical protein
MVGRDAEDDLELAKVAFELYAPAHASSSAPSIMTRFIA